MPPRKQGPMQKPKNAFGAFKRILSYMAEYKALLLLVVVFIICSSLANVIGTSFLQKIIDNYLTPLSRTAEMPSFTEALWQFWDR